MFQSATRHLGNAEQFDLIAHIGGLTDVFDGDRADPFEFDIVKADLRSKSNRRQQCQFVTGVNAANVQVRVRLKIPKVVRLIEGLLIGQARIFHPGQDVVAGAIHNAHHAADAICGQTFVQGLDHGNAARDGCLEPDHAARCLGSEGQILTVVGQHGLVGCDNILARGNRRLGCGFGRTIVAAHQFHENINVITTGQRNGVRFPSIGR